jgi:hypothetical protein
MAERRPDRLKVFAKVLAALNQLAPIIGALTSAALAGRG